MKFSVLLSVYNKERPGYLIQSLESLVNQTVVPDEIVIVKDGPLTYALEEVLESYKYSFINDFKIITLEKNVGLGEALAVGLKMCTNDLVARMDTDDICLPNRFETQLKVFQKNPNLSLCGGQIIEFESDLKHVLGKRNVPCNEEKIRKWARWRNPFNHVTVMFKKQDILDIGNYQTCFYMEDYHLWARLLMSNKHVMNLPDVLVHVRGGGSMLVRRGGMNYLKAILQGKKKLVHMGFISYREYLMMAISHIVMSFVSIKIRKALYQKGLRSEGREHVACQK